MCGIVGIIGEILQENNQEINDMLDSINHRGPDHQKFKIYKNALLGSARLSVVNQMENSNQPFHSKNNNSILVFNGEIYNFKELSKRFDIENVTKSDTEMIIELYEKIGIDFINFLEGMYSFCIVDLKRNISYICRDSLGIKPLYYYHKNDKLYFSSEIKALFNITNNNFTYNENTIYDFLALGLLDHSKNTFFENIFSLAPGELIKIENNSLSHKIKIPYLEIAKNNQDKEYKDIENSLKEEIFNSVKLQSNTVRTIGTHLSGGVDSTLLTLMLSQIHNNIDSYTFGYEEQEYDEREKAKFTSKALKIPNYSSTLKFEDVDNWFLETLRAHDEPFTSLRQLSHLKLYKDFEKKGSTVIFEASGGDEIGAGYRGMIWPLFLDECLENGYEKAFENLLVRSRNRNLEKQFSTFISQSALNSVRYGICTSDGTYSSSLTYLKNKNKIKESVSNNQISNKPFSSFLQNAQYYELRSTKLPRGLRYIDRSSSSAGREARVPLLSNKIVGLSLSLPSYRKIDNYQSRIFLTDIAKKINPNLEDLKLKKDIADPQRYWLKNEMSNIIKEVFKSKRFKNRNLFEIDLLNQDFNLYCNQKKEFHSLIFFNIFILEIWLRYYIDLPLSKANEYQKLSDFINETNN